jgi:hypothetical protein
MGAHLSSVSSRATLPRPPVLLALRSHHLDPAEKLPPEVHLLPFRQQNSHSGARGNPRSHLRLRQHSQDRNQAAVTFGGHVATEAGKPHAESIGRSIPLDQVAANQIAVLKSGVESDDRIFKHDVKASVVTLRGEVASQSERARAQEVASAAPNVKQVVNELQVKKQKASSSKREIRKRSFTVYGATSSSSYPARTRQSRS